MTKAPKKHRKSPTRIQADRQRWLADFRRWLVSAERRMAERGVIDLRLLDFRYYLLTHKCRWLFWRGYAETEADRETVWQWWRRLHFVNQHELVWMRPKEYDWANSREQRNRGGR